MSKKQEEKKLGITVKKGDDMPEWYEQVVLKSELADFAPIKGFMVIRPRGYFMWERIQDYFNGRIKELGVSNTSFPLLIPESYFKKEASHIEGFAPELAWIEQKEGEERLAIRPTSETIIHDFFSKWIRSHRDLPLRINQWCNVLRWEVKQTKIFLRTREFLWQEGHCAYEDEEQCEKEALMFLGEYKKLSEDLLAIPVITGEKTEAERFPGAKRSYTIESLMPDGKALQMGTSHNLGQGFSKVFNVTFKGKDEKEHLAWLSSWGFSTRLLGAVVMVHGDDHGLVLPPALVDKKAVIVPIVIGKDTSVLKKADEVNKMLSDLNPFVDDREEYSPGWKYNEWELKGIPLRIEIGPRDIEKNQIVVVRRDTGKKEFIKIDTKLQDTLQDMLGDMQKEMLQKAKKFLDSSIVEVSSDKELIRAIKDKKLALAPFCGLPSCEERIKDKTNGATSRCIKKKSSGNCVGCGKPAKFLTYFGKGY